jgi:hypothetical protein
MKYTLFLAHDPANQPEYGSETFKAYMMAYATFGEEASKAGVFVAGEPVDDVDTATTLRKEDGEIKYHDGPFAELKEQIGGWYLLECENLEEALRWAEKVPLVAYGYGAVEVRPVPDVSDLLKG